VHQKKFSFEVHQKKFSFEVHQKKFSFEVHQKKFSQTSLVKVDYEGGKKSITSHTQAKSKEKIAIFVQQK